MNNTVLMEHMAIQLLCMINEETKKRVEKVLKLIR